MAITKKPFGTLQSGAAVTEYTLTNGIGASVSIIDFGGTITKLCVPDREGNLGDVVLGFDDLTYEGNGASMGAIIGRFGNRIGGAEFQLDGKTYTLAKNDGNHSLHGGNIGYNKRMWAAKAISGEGEDRLELTLTDPDMYEGFPGTLELSVTYVWDDKCNLGIIYHATTDKSTVINLTNHSYFNLSGCDGRDVKGHVLQVNAGYVTEADAELIPTGKLIPQTEVTYNFAQPVTIGSVLEKMDGDVAMKGAGGVDFNYCLGRDRERKLAAVLYSPETGREMQVLTDEPGVQIYTGNNLNHDGKNGVHYGSFAGVCLETQHYPDSIHHPQFQSVVLRPCDVYHTETVYAFSVR